MISVVVPTKHNAKDLEECLQSLQKQSFKNFEIVVVAPREAKTVDVARRHGAKIAYDDVGTIGNAYAEGAVRSKGDIIAFIDDDAHAPTSWLSGIIKEFRKGDADVIGGDDLLPKVSSAFQKAAYQIDLARHKRTVFGKKAAARLRAVNIAFKKEVFSKANFNRNLKGLQEPEFLHRLLKQGCKMKFSPQLYVYHKRRDSIDGIFSQIFRNGKAKMTLLRLHKDMANIYDVLPFAALAYAALLWFYAPQKFFLLLLAPFAAYFLLKPAMILLKTRKPQYYPLLFAIVFVREVAYGLGILFGIRNLFRKQ